MKKTILSAFAACSLGWGITLGGFELSPEVGAGVQKVKTNGESHYDWSAFARLWVGVSNFVVAPQFKYMSIDNGKLDAKNTPVGVSAGYRLDLVVLSATPYVGANYSHFDKFYDDTLACNAGVRVSPAILPVSVGVEYEFQKPNDFFGRRQKMESVRFSLGVSF